MVKTKDLSRKHAIELGEHDAAARETTKKVGKLNGVIWSSQR